MRYAHARSRTLASVCVAWLLLAAGVGQAQQVQLARQRGPYYVGEPVVVQVVASGLTAGSQPTCRLQGEPPSGVSIQGPRISQSSQSFVQMFNGRVSRKESVEYRFSFIITAEREGQYAIGPFEVTIDGTPQTVDGASFQFGKLENDPDMHIELVLPRSSVYVGEELPVQIHWSFSGELEAIQFAYSRLQIRSPLFDQFTFKQPPRKSRTTLTIATAKGGMEIDAKASQRESAGRPLVEVSGSLILVADTPGRYDAVPITCRTEKVSRWRRDLFGDLVAQDTTPALAAGKPLSFVVKPIPLTGRPVSFSGAVGRGFSIDVTADRSVVRIGDPIALTVSVTGDGNLQSVSLPPLASSAGFAEDLFQVQSEDVAGEIEGNTKKFLVNVRVRDLQAVQIPPLAFSSFDPAQEKFVTTESKPIALQVRETQVVSAADVMSARPPNNRDEQMGMAATGRPPTETALSTGMALIGANLAIQQDPAHLLMNTAGSVSSRPVTGGLYGLSVLLLIGSLAVRRHRQRDWTSVRRKRRLKTLRQEIARATALPPKEAADGVSRAVRALVAEFEQVDRVEADRIISLCDNTAYAVGELGQSNLSDAANRALGLVDQVAKT